MSTFQISPSLNLISTIDNQIIEIVPGIVNLDGITGTTGPTGVQGPTGPPGPAFTSQFADNAFEVYNSADPTKIFELNVSNVSSATTRTFTVPNGNGIFPMSYSSSTSIGIGNTFYINEANCTSFGYNCLLNNYGNNNVAIGYNALQNNSGSNIIAIGANSLVNNSGSNNITIGTNSSMSNGSVSNNIIVGNNISNLFTGGYNTIIGHSAGYTLSSGTGNTIVGNSAATTLNVGASNTIIGTNTNYNLGSGDSNTVIGASACSGLTMGSSNTVIGNSAGTSLTSGTGNIIIGANAQALTAASNYSLVIGDTNFQVNAVATGPQATTPWLNTTIGNTLYNIPLAFPTAASTRLPVVSLTTSNAVFCNSNYQYNLNLGASIIINLPSSPNNGDWVIVCDSNGSFRTYNPQFYSVSSSFYVSFLGISATNSFNCNINNSVFWFIYVSQGSRWLTMTNAGPLPSFFNLSSGNIALGNSSYSSIGTNQTIYGNGAAPNLNNSSNSNVVIGGGSLTGKSITSGTSNIVIGSDVDLPGSSNASGQICIGDSTVKSNSVSSSTLNTVSNKIKITIGGTTYYLLASVSPS